MPDLFQVKPARMVRKASGYVVMLRLDAEVNVPTPTPHGHVGLVYCLSTADGQHVNRPRFLNKVHRQLKFELLSNLVYEEELSSVLVSS